MVCGAARDSPPPPSPLKCIIYILTIPAASRRFHPRGRARVAPSPLKCIVTFRLYLRPLTPKGIPHTVIFISEACYVTLQLHPPPPSALHFPNRSLSGAFSSAGPRAICLSPPPPFVVHLSLHSNHTCRLLRLAVDRKYFSEAFLVCGVAYDSPPPLSPLLNLPLHSNHPCRILRPRVCQ